MQPRFTSSPITSTHESINSPINLEGRLTNLSVISRCGGTYGTTTQANRQDVNGLQPESLNSSLNSKFHANRCGTCENTTQTNVQDVNGLQPEPLNASVNSKSHNTNHANILPESKEAKRLDEEIAAIRENIESDCLLFFKLGKEIDRLLQDAYHKEQQIVYQGQLIDFLFNTVILFYYKLKKMYELTTKYVCLIYVDVFFF